MVRGHQAVGIGEHVSQVDVLGIQDGGLQRLFLVDQLQTDIVQTAD